MNAPQNEPRTNKAIAARLIDLCLVSQGRCHLIGACACATLLVAIAWLWTHSSVLLTESGTNPKRLQEAVLILGQEDLLRDHYAKCLDQLRSIRERRKSIDTWLPNSVDWPATEGSIRDITQQLNLELISLQRQGEHVGSRVGVVAAEIQVRGDFHAICDLLRRIRGNVETELHRDERPKEVNVAAPEVADAGMEVRNVSSASSLAEPIVVDHGRRNAHLLPYPIWCHHVTLHRDPDPRSETGSCVASIWLRIPFAAAGTAAAQLDSEVNNDAS